MKRDKNGRELVRSFIRRYSQLCLPDGSHPNFYDRIKTGDPAMFEVALCFLEVRP